MSRLKLIPESTRIDTCRGGFRRKGQGGGGQTPSPQEFEPLPTQRYFIRIHFWPTDPKIFLKTPLAPIYTNFEGERAPKKNGFFLSNFSKKCPKTAFLTCFFKKLPAAQKIWPKQGLFTALGELCKSI